MDRRNFLQTSVAVTAGALTSTGLPNLARAEQTPSRLIPKRKLGKTGEELSIIGLGGVVVMNNSPSYASNIVAEAVDRGISAEAAAISVTFFPAITDHSWHGLP